MISVVIETQNAAPTLATTLASLIRAAVNNLVREVVIADLGSTDETLEIADDAGARVVQGGLVQACAAAKGPWLLILTTGVRLEHGWEKAAGEHIEHHESETGYFRLALDDHRLRARLREAAASVAQPRPEQGLLVAKRVWEAGEARKRLRPLSARAIVGT